ncbi:MAG: glycosyltransferase [Candidatus Staskawiczbacteria bacterium]|nr:glycosyltransferase [Candidatus Staskawiczbacteria bacterium]
MDIEEYAKYRQFYMDRAPKLFLEYFDKASPDTFLDLGCGDGSLLYALNKKGYLKGKKVYAVDLSRNRIELVKKINKDIICSVEDACNVKSLGSDSVNFISSVQLIEHVESDEDLVKEVCRMLSENGIVYLSTVFKKWYGWYFYKCNGRWALDPTHLREYTKESQLLDVLRKYNLEVIENRKTLTYRSVINFILKKIGAEKNIFASSFFMRLARNIKIPIFGYYNWEIVCIKKGKKLSQKNKIAIVSPAPLYYIAPFYKKIALSSEIDLTVYYCSKETIDGIDVKKRYKTKSDITPKNDLLQGYKYKFIKNYSPMPSYLISPLGLINLGVLKEIKNGKFDAVILYAWNDLTWWLAFYACLKSNTPVIFMTDNNILSEHQDVFLKRLAKQILLKFLFKRTSGFLAAGEANRQMYLYYGAKPEKILKMPFSWGYENLLEKGEKMKAERKSIRRSFGVKEDDFVILYVGRLSVEKSPIALLEAYGKIASENKKLFIVGDGPIRKKVEQTIDRSNLHNVKMVGFQQRDSVFNFYAMADAFVMPSKKDALPLAVNEAMCFGLPVIASDKVGSIVDLVKNEYNGFVFPVGDVNELAVCIEKLMNLPAEDKKVFGDRSRDAIYELVSNVDPVGQIIKLIPKSNSKL